MIAMAREGEEIGEKPKTHKSITTMVLYFETLTLKRLERRIS